MASRRTVILGAGVTTAALVGIGGWWRVSRVPETATRPWLLTAAPPPADVRLDALRHAILAPNPHNRQPWLLRLVGDDTVELRCDLDRRLPATDPFDRQILIGFGTFSELAAIAASTRGQRVDIALFPDGLPGDRLDSRAVAHLRFIADSTVAADPLATVIPARRSTKERFDEPRAVPPTLLRKLMSPLSPGIVTGFATEAAQLAPIRETIKKAFEIEARLPRTYRESIDLMRIGAPEIDANPDGIDLAGPVIETLALAGQISREQLADPRSPAFQQGLDQQLGVYGSLPAAIWLTTAGNGRADQFAAGRCYARMNLLATALGLKMHPVSQSLQEYPEMADQYRRIHEVLGATGNQRVQMLARIGYGPVTEPAPRWPLESHFRT
jgi:nitroreductase